MSRDVPAYRSQDSFGDPGGVARANHEQIEVPGEVDEQPRSVALLDPGIHEDRPVLVYPRVDSINSPSAASLVASRVVVASCTENVADGAGGGDCVACQAINRTSSGLC